MVRYFDKIVSEGLIPDAGEMIYVYSTGKLMALSRTLNEEAG